MESWKQPQRREDGPAEACEYALGLVAILTGVVAAAFLMMVIGVHKGDRAPGLSDAHVTILDYLTRRALGLAVRR
jgi:hypothetical protein